MQRLLQGDVGSGKTVVALYALLRAVENGRQGALMAPTETLAEQHFLTIDEPLPGARRDLRAADERVARSASATLAQQATIVVGTHALIQEGVELRDLARRGRRRAAPLRRRAAQGALTQGRAPHVLHMTATPIPRTLALTVYGDLAVSEIAKPPASASRSCTRWVTEEKASEAYTRLTRASRRGAAGVRRLPADRGVGDDARARGRGGGGAAAARRAARLPRRLPARPAASRPSGAS